MVPDLFCVFPETTLPSQQWAGLLVMGTDDMERERWEQPSSLKAVIPRLHCGQESPVELIKHQVLGPGPKHCD